MASVANLTAWIVCCGLTGTVGGVNGAGGAGLEPVRFRLTTATPSDGFASPGLELIAVDMTSVPRALTFAPMTTVVWRPKLKKSSGHVTVWPLALQPGPRSMIAPL